MGIAASQRGNAVISRQIAADLKARPQAAKGFERDRGMREYLRLLEQRLQSALRRFRLVDLEKDAERRRAAAILEAVEQTYAEALAEGLRPGPALYWLALARHRARGADPSAQPAARMYDEPRAAAVEVG